MSFLGKVITSSFDEITDVDAVATIRKSPMGSTKVKIAAEFKCEVLL